MLFDPLQASPFYRLLSISGHYNVQLAVLATLRLDTYVAAREVRQVQGTPKVHVSSVPRTHWGKGV